MNEENLDRQVFEVGDILIGKFFFSLQCIHLVDGFSKRNGIVGEGLASTSLATLMSAGADDVIVIVVIVAVERRQRRRWSRLQQRSN